MANSPNPTVQNAVPMPNLSGLMPKKQPPEELDLALSQELEELIRDAKGQAAKIEEPSELWGLESWLTKRRREIDEGMTIATPFFHSCSHLLRDGRLTEDDLHGLGQGKARPLFAELRPSENQFVAR
jgi:hypothetical protein